MPYVDIVAALTLPGTTMFGRGTQTALLVPHPAIDRLARLTPSQKDIPGYNGSVRMHNICRGQLLLKAVVNVYLIFVSSFLAGRPMH